jgi:prepilin-type N-terminal cleavage/methylation domain-containing protein
VIKILPTSRPAAARRGFTIMEMIVVIVLLLALLALVLPAFVSIKRSSEFSVSQELVKQAVRDARGRALSSNSDSAVVFSYNPENGLQLIACTRLGSIIDGNLNNPNDPTNPAVTRDVFAPVTGRKPVTLPVGVSVRGYAPAFKVDAHWYEPINNGGNRYTVDEPAWVFPETDFYSRLVTSAASAQDVGSDRQTFMVRFQARTGQLVASEPTAAVVVFPRPSASGRGAGTIAGVERLDLSTDVAAQVAAIIERPEWGGVASAAKPVGQRDLLGDDSSDTVLTRSVGRLAVYRERDLAQALGTRLDPVSQTIYELPANYKAALAGNRSNRTVYPQYLPELRNEARTPLMVSRWVEGFGNLTDASSNVRSTGARPIIYSVHPLRGELVEEVAQ